MKKLGSVGRKYILTSSDEFIYVVVSFTHLNCENGTYAHKNNRIGRKSWDRSGNRNHGVF